MPAAKFRFDFEKLETYKQAFRLNREVFTSSLKFRRLLQSSLGDQLRRASLSILTNLAEGSGQDSRPQKKRFYKYAYNSARECIPILASACSLEALSATTHQKLRDDFVVVIRMLAKLIKSVEGKSQSSSKKQGGDENQES